MALSMTFSNRFFVGSILGGAAFLMWRFLVGGFWHAIGATIVYLICAVIVNWVVNLLE